ncbi:MAG: S-methyl-5'-thioadenosine phosphorylase [Acidobacteriota bacterium]
MNLVGIIGGTGVYDPAILKDVKDEVVDTEYGKARVKIGYYNDWQVAFMARHGEDHSVPPHLINYRANIKAMQQLGVKRIIATAAVGSLNFDYGPGALVIVDQILDFTKSRVSTFYEGGTAGVVHVDVTDPYCPEIRKALFESAKSLGLDAYLGGCYVCTEGPRFETGAEIRMYKQLGGDVVGMTTVPEAILAREMGICYATVAVVTNYAAGMVTGRLTHAEVVDYMKNNVTNVRKTIMKAVALIPDEYECECREILNEIGVQP